ncbi:unnamed protein product [Coffea canephora]|uniref:Organ-specific protein S2-like n=1 Tax=Coffea canephora TaxID=49390 RepID=A0A068V4Q0_COFCA|nr:unnamed protein product [Coffea canephora]
MASTLAFIALFSLALFAGFTKARKDPGEYWQGVVARNDQALFEAIEQLAHVASALSNKKKIASDCDTMKKHSVAATNKKSFVKDFEPRPNVSAYGDDAKLKEEKSFMRDFEPRPNVSAYGDNTDKSFVKDFEPRPNVSAYGDNTDKAFAKDFEPRPNVSVYDN